MPRALPVRRLRLRRVRQRRSPLLLLRRPDELAPQPRAPHALSAAPSGRGGQGGGRGGGRRDPFPAPRRREFSAWMEPSRTGAPRACRVVLSIPAASVTLPPASGRAAT